VHYWWFVKADIRVPLQYASVVALLLLLRVPPVRRFVITLRYRLAPKVRQARASRPKTKIPADANLNEATSR
jgi:DMSO/TMAO reductase YedYZ heme-binding membrane subunit